MVLHFIPVDQGLFGQTENKVVWARNCQLTVSSYSPLEIATGRRPPDLFDVETGTPEQFFAEQLRRTGPCCSSSVSL